jgi:hypothetical protein
LSIHIPDENVTAADVPAATCLYCGYLYIKLELSTRDRPPLRGVENEAQKRS